MEGASAAPRELSPQGEPSLQETQESSRARRAPKRSLSSRRIRHSFKRAGSASEGARLAPLKGAGKEEPPLKGAPEGVSTPKGAREAPRKSLRSRGARRAPKGVSAPKGARGAPREPPLQESQNGLQMKYTFLRETSGAPEKNLRS